MFNSTHATYGGKIYTVSELTRDIRLVLEGRYAAVCLRGEVSNLRTHSSGHCYFTLKDAEAQLSAVLFRNNGRQLRFRLQDGLSVIAAGRIGLYEARGQYQLIVEHLEPQGRGALHLAFEQLCRKLRDAGLFAAGRKRPLPMCPQRLGLITSPTGAVLRDMLHIVRRRNPHVDILFCPVSVQGENAASQLVVAIEQINQHQGAEVLILARGGGSLEDLWAFNTEEVAYAIYRSKIPVISAIGHETDVTISDFVADVRAPTPSVAAELAVPIWADLKTALYEQEKKLARTLQFHLIKQRQKVRFWASHLPPPRRCLEAANLRLDDLMSNLRTRLVASLQQRRLRWRQSCEKLETLSPLSVLARGYAIVSKGEKEHSTRTIIKTAAQVSTGDAIQIQLYLGSLQAQITHKQDTNFKNHRDASTPL